MLQGHRRDFHHTTTKIAFHHPQATFRGKRANHRTQNVFVEAFNRAFAPDQLAVLQERLLGIATQAMAGHGVDVFVEQAGLQQFADQERHPARRLEVVDIGLAIRVHVGQGRHHLGEVGHVLPGQLDARRLGNSRHVQGMVGRTAGGMQRDDGVDQRPLVDDFPDRHEVAALLGHARDLERRLAGQGIAQRGIRVDEGRARQVQAHDFHQQLIGVGSAVERAGARAVVGLHFRLQQLFATGLAFGVTLADVGFFLVGNARDHRSTWDENGRQMTEA